MATVSLLRAQAAGLLELSDRMAASGAPPTSMSGKGFLAANRSLERSDVTALGVGRIEPPAHEDRGARLAIRVAPLKLPKAEHAPTPS